MDNLYSYEQMMAQRQRDLANALHKSKLLQAARTDQEVEQSPSWRLADLAQPRRILRLGRLVIMW